MTNETWFNLRQNKLFFFSPKQTASGTHTASYTVGAMGCPLRLQWPRCEDDHSPPSSTRVKNEWCYTPSSSICLHGTDRDNFALFAFHIFVHLQALCLQSVCHIIQYSGTMRVWYFWDGQSHLLVIFFFSHKLAAHMQDHRPTNMWWDKWYLKSFTSQWKECKYTEWLVLEFNILFSNMLWLSALSTKTPILLLDINIRIIVTKWLQPQEKIIIYFLTQQLLFFQHCMTLLGKTVNHI
jgi:hypothetical protein